MMTAQGSRDGRILRSRPRWQIRRRPVRKVHVRNHHISPPVTSIPLTHTADPWNSSPPPWHACPLFAAPSPGGSHNPAVVHTLVSPCCHLHRIARICPRHRRARIGGGHGDDRCRCCRRLARHHHHGQFSISSNRWITTHPTYIPEISFELA